MKKLLLFLSLVTFLSTQAHKEQPQTKLKQAAHISFGFVGGSIFGAYCASKVHSKIYGQHMQNNTPVSRAVFKILSIMLGRAGRTALIAPVAYKGYKKYFA